MYVALLEQVSLIVCVSMLMCLCVRKTYEGEKKDYKRQKDV